jgi:hypothetical protein
MAMTTSKLAPASPGGIGYRTLAALFLALVAAILGAIPGWKLCFAAWLVLSWLMLAMLPMGLLSMAVEFASAQASLVARADASARAGGPAIAMTPTSDEDWPLPTRGFVYDRDGVLRTPPARRPAAWRADPVVAALTGECVELRHVVGPYYRWSGGCDAV